MTRPSGRQSRRRLRVVEDEQPDDRGPSGRAGEIARLLDELVLPLAELDDVADLPLELDLLAATICCGVRSLTGDPAISDQPASLVRSTTGSGRAVAAAGDAIVDLVVERAAAGSPGYGECLGALAVHGGPLSARSADASARLGLGPTTMARYAGRLRVAGAHLIEYRTGDAFEILLELSYPGTTDRPGYVLSFETFDGPRLVAVDVTEDVALLLAEVEAQEALVKVENVPVADALNTMDHAFWVLDRTLGEPDDESLGYHRTLIDCLLSSEPRSEEVFTLRVEVTDDERQRLTSELVAWIDTHDPTLADAAAPFAAFAVDFAADRAGDPHRWTASVAVRFLEHTSTEVTAPAEHRRAVPDLLRQAIGWAHAHNGWAAHVTAETLEVVDQVEPLFRAELDGAPMSQPATAGLGRLLGLLGLDDMDGDDPLHQMASTILAAAGPMAVEPPVGGSHPEPFDGTGIPPGLLPLVSAIAETSSRLAGELFDHEFVTITRRFIADTARQPASPFGKGKPAIWASAAIYAVAQLNDVPGGWNRLSRSSIALTANLPGASSTIINKARELRKLAGLGYGGPARYAHSGAVLDMAELFSRLDLLASPNPAATARPPGTDPSSIDDGAFVVRASLLDTRPEVWRRFRLPIDATFAQLHQLLQLTFGWYDCHLHSFDVDGLSVGPVGPDLDLDLDAAEDELRLCEVLRPGAEAVYTYDFGDDWQHLIEVEELVLGASQLEYGPWAVLDGNMASPPEDCGGPWLYQELLAARKDTSHPHSDELAEIFPPGFDPKRFEVTTLNDRARNHDWSTPHRAGPW